MLETVFVKASVVTDAFHEKSVMKKRKPALNAAAPT
jgi:hypothetical protein